MFFRFIYKISYDKDYFFILKDFEVKIIVKCNTKKTRKIELKINIYNVIFILKNSIFYPTIDNLLLEG